MTTTTFVPPLAGPAVTQELHDTMSTLALDAFRPDRPTLDYGFEAGKLDPGTVPGHVMPALHKLARSLGYRVRVHDSAGRRLLGYTHGAWAPGEPHDVPEFIITIQPGMSAASTARVLMHELGHVILGHSPRNEREAARSAITRLLTALSSDDGEADDNTQECAAELAAGTVCELAGIGSGLASRYSLHCRADGMALDVFYAGLLAARTLWVALEVKS